MRTILKIYYKGISINVSSFSYVTEERKKAIIIRVSSQTLQPNIFITSVTSINLKHALSRYC